MGWFLYCGVHADFFAWLMPRFVSKDMLVPAWLFIGTVFGFISAICAWHRDLILERGLEQSPESAEVIWADCKKNGTPYAVYLRSFNHERLQNPFPTPLPIPLMRSGGSARRVELWLVKVLRRRLPILALSDPAYPFSMPGAHRFSHLVIPWPIFLEHILRRSSLIILYIAESNPGLVFEINLIRELGFTHKSLVIVDGSDFKPFPDFKWVTNEKTPYFENTLAEILESFENAHLERVPDEIESAASSSGVSQVSREHRWQRLNQPDSMGAIAAQVFMFLLPLIMAFMMWGMPDILLHEYWLHNKPMSEIRKMQEDIRQINDRFK